MAPNTQRRVLVLAVVAMLLTPAVGAAAKTVAAHPAHVLNARERLITPRIGQGQAAASIFGSSSSSFDWSAAGLGLGTGIAICVLALGTLMATRRLRRPTITTALRGSR